MKPNLFGIALIAIGFLFIDASVNARSPVDVVKAIMTGKPIPAKGSGKSGANSSTAPPSKPPGLYGPGGNALGGGTPT